MAGAVRAGAGWRAPYERGQEVGSDGRGAIHGSRTAAALRTRTRAQKLAPCEQSRAGRICTSGKQILMPGRAMCAVRPHTADGLGPHRKGQDAADVLAVLTEYN
ncbi:hypothetical protein GCM10009789_56310 [Kribbella sancticallisti]|uniref:Uncharacterized protein n=1 Tax=Kribbella sancticallisti TaxID=460087 RepID=A0ABN2E391_9ACTN